MGPFSSAVPESWFTRIWLQYSLLSPTNLTDMHKLADSSNI